MHREPHGATVSRRAFLHGGVSIGAAVGGAMIARQALVDGTKAAPEGGAHQWAFVVDLRRCDGCERCTAACQQVHYLAKEQVWIRVYRITSATGQQHFMPRLCMHCENAPCVKVCPVAATFKNDEGVVLVNQNTCIGCRTCMAACPYEARYFNWDEPPPAPSPRPRTRTVRSARAMYCWARTCTPRPAPPATESAAT